jgi:Meckel syndrome type 1 protein
MSERDPQLEKLYREHSREEPPPALDAAILAAAHRAVDSGPRKAGAQATRPQRWWMPLAAAAAIGVIAIGVVQQMPKETAIDVTSDAAAPHPNPLPASGERESSSAPSSAMRAPSTPAPATANQPSQTPDVQAPPAAPPAAPPSAPPASTQAFAPAPPARPAPAPITPSAPVEQRPQAPAAMERSTPASDARALAKKQSETAAAPPPAPPAPAAKPAMPAPRAEAPARENKLAEPVPFPAAPAPVGKTEPASADAAKRDAPAQTPMSERRKDAGPRDQASSAGAAMAPRPPAPAPAAAPAPAPALSRAQGDSVGRLAQSQGFEQEMQALARDPDAWIARIRKLRDEGNIAQAQRELKEFRALVADAERKLPADLKSLQP